MTHHGVNTPVARILQLVKDWSIHRLTKCRASILPVRGPRANNARGQGIYVLCEEKVQPVIGDGRSGDGGGGHGS